MPGPYRAWYSSASFRPFFLYISVFIIYSELIILATAFVLSALSASSEEPIPRTDESVRDTIKTHSEIISYQLTKSELTLHLIGTITGDKGSKAFIKNPITGELGKYTAGDIIDIVRDDNAILLEISDCMVLLERDGNFETLECDNKLPSVVFDGPAVLSKYRVVKPGGNIDFSGSYMTEFDDDIKLLSQKHNVDPYLVKAVIKAESDFNPDAVSPKNAQGIMQLIPSTASDYGVSDPFDARENIEGGVKYLKDLLEYFEGDVELSLAAYNAGQGAVIKHGFTIPPYPETAKYITKVLKYYKMLKADRYALTSKKIY